MAAASVTYTSGEKRRIWGRVKAQPTDDNASPTFTITGTPTLTLYDPTGSVVTGYNGVAVTGMVAGPAAQVSAWLLFDTTDPNLAPSTWYRAVFRLSLLDNNGKPTIVEPALSVRYVPAGVP